MIMCQTLDGRALMLRLRDTIFDLVISEWCDYVGMVLLASGFHFIVLFRSHDTNFAFLIIFSVSS